MIQTLVTTSPTTCFCLLGILSWLIGSFLNVVIYRLPHMLKTEWVAQCQTYLNLTPSVNKPNINLCFPRSHCPFCNTTIPFWHNIPLFSYIILRGRCASCQHPISYRYPFVEALCLVLSLSASYVFGLTLTLVFALLFIWILICLGFIDQEHQILPDSLTLGLLWLGLIANTQQLFTSLPNAVLSAASAYLTLWLLMHMFYKITGKVGMGHGDFKLFAAFGAWFGWTLLPFILLLASCVGAFGGLMYLHTTKKSKETPIPFGPSLCFAGLVALFAGQPIVTWYLRSCGA